MAVMLSVNKNNFTHSTIISMLLNSSASFIALFRIARTVWNRRNVKKQLCLISDCKLLKRHTGKTFPDAQ
jgi:hypothetical protein